MRRRSLQNLTPSMRHPPAQMTMLGLTKQYGPCIKRVNQWKGSVLVYSHLVLFPSFCSLPPFSFLSPPPPPPPPLLIMLINLCGFSTLVYASEGQLPSSVLVRTLLGGWGWIGRVCNQLLVSYPFFFLFQEYFEIVSAMSNGDVSYDSVLLICNHSDAAGKFYFQLNKHVLPMRNNPVVPLLALKTATPTKPMDTLFEEAEQEDTPEATAHLVFAILHAQVKPTFHKINVHAAMTPADVKCQFEPVLSQARALREACKQAQRFNDEISSSYFVTVSIRE